MDDGQYVPVLRLSRFKKRHTPPDAPRTSITCIYMFKVFNTNVWKTLYN